MMSGFVVKFGESTWIGCGTEDELNETYDNMIDDAVEDDLPWPGNLEIRPATPDEIKRFEAEIGDPP